MKLRYGTVEKPARYWDIIETFGPYRTEGEARKAVCGMITNLRKRDFVDMMMGRIGSKDYEYEVDEFFDLDGKCVAANEDGDDDGVPDNNYLTKPVEVWDECPGTQPGTPVNYFGCPCTSTPGNKDNTQTEPNTNPENPSINHPPNIVRMSYTPDYPVDTDVVTIDVEAEDPDNDDLTYSWTLDGTQQQTTIVSTISYPKPSVGDHTVGVTVSDPDGLTAYDEVEFIVSQHVTAPDSDGDGLDDDSDLCPLEPSTNPDGCPDFDVTLECRPNPPAVGQAVACRAPVVGKHKDATVELTWFLDGDQMQSSESQTWAWSQAQTGSHIVQVTAMTQEHSKDAMFSMEVGAAQELTVYIGMLPDPPVPDKVVLLTAAVEGNRPGENLTFEWTVDDELVCTDASCTVQAAGGTHTVKLVVRGQGREATTLRTFDVTSAAVKPADVSAAGFAVDDLSCNDGLNSDENLVCNAHITRLRQDVDLLNVVWLIEGKAVEPATSLDSSFTFTLPQPAPGEHAVGFQAIDPKTGLPQNKFISVTVNPGANAAIPPFAQTAAATGTLIALGAWMWWEYALRKRAEAREAAAASAAEAADDQLRKGRSGWFEDETKAASNSTNAKRREQGLVYDSGEDDWEAGHEYTERDVQRRCEKTWQEMFNKLLNLGEESDKMKAILDFLQRHQGEAYKNGVWDPEALDRLMRMSAQLGLTQSESDWYKHAVDFRNRALPPSLETAADVSRGWTAWAGRLVTDMATGGYAEGFWTPATATIEALEDNSRRALEGKPLWTPKDIHDFVNRKGAELVLIDRIVGPALERGVGWVIGQPAVQGWSRGAGEWVAKKAGPVGRAIADNAPQRAKEWARSFWENRNMSVGDAARKAVGWWRGGAPGSVPTIRMSWGDPVVRLDTPLNPSRAPVPPIGWGDRMAQLNAIDHDLADSVGRVMGAGSGRGDFHMEPVDHLSRGEQVLLTADEQNGLSLLNDPSYRQALEQGLVPPEVRTLVNHVRDKVCKASVFGAYENLPAGLRGQISRIDFTGTGARPRSPAAISGWTDLDITVRATDPESSLGREAETAMRDAFNDMLRNTMRDPREAGVTMFPGVRPNLGGVETAGYSSQEMLVWHETDVTLRARCAVPTGKGSMTFNAHPDVSPVPGHGPFGLPPAARLAAQAELDPARAVFDARRIIQTHVAAMTDPTPLQILRSEGKQAHRVWWVENAGRGEELPPPIRTLDHMKEDRTWVPSPQELDEAWDYFTRTFHLSPH